MQTIGDGRAVPALYHGWIVVGFGFVAAVFAWGLGLFGASVYLHALTSGEGWSISLVSGAITVFYMVNGVLLTAVGGGIDRWGPRPVVMVGTLALGGGVAGLGLATASWHLYLAFGVMGVGWASLSTTGIAAMLAPWFERQQGRAVSLALMGASVGSMLGVPALLFGIGTLGFDRAVLAAGLATLAVLLPFGLWALRWRGPGDLGLHADGARPVPLAEGAVPPAPPRLWTRAAAIRTRSLQTVAIGFALALGVQVGFLTHHVKLAEPALGVTGAGVLVAATGLAGLLGRMFLAAIADRVNVRRLAAVAIGLHCLSLVAIVAMPSPTVLILASLTFGFAVGNVTTLSPIIVRREFGAGSFGALYGTAATVIQFGLACGPVSIGLLRDHFGDYGPALACAAVVDFVALCIVLAGRKPD